MRTQHVRHYERTSARVAALSALAMLMAATTARIETCEAQVQSSYFDPPGKTLQQREDDSLRELRYSIDYAVRQRERLSQSDSLSSDDSRALKQLPRTIDSMLVALKVMEQAYHDRWLAPIDPDTLWVRRVRFVRDSLELANAIKELRRCEKVFYSSGGLMPQDRVMLDGFAREDEITVEELAIRIFHLNAQIRTYEERMQQWDAIRHS